MKRRNKLDIMADILCAAKEGANSMSIVYDTRLNFKIWKKYLSELMNHGLIEAHKGSTIYKTTENGLEFLEQYASFRKYR